MGDTPCVLHCGRPADGYFVCWWCSEDLAAALADVPRLLDELLINERRGARYSDATRAGGLAAVQPLPYDPGAADTRNALLTAVQTWSFELAAYAGAPFDPDTPADCALWLRSQVHQVRVFPAAETLHQDLTGVIRRGWRVVDRAPGRVYVGPCGAETDEGICGADLYARADPNRPGQLDSRQAVVRCPGCGVQWDAEQRRSWLLDELRESLATAREIALAVGMLAGTTVNVKTIRTWAGRGQIHTHYPPGGGTPRHRIGDVIDRAMNAATRRGRRCVTRARSG